MDFVLFYFYGGVTEFFAPPPTLSRPLAKVFQVKLNSETTLLSFSTSYSSRDLSQGTFQGNNTLV